MLPFLESQGRAEDVLLRHRFCYYVLHAPVITDGEYDALERMVSDRWSINGVSDTVGSDDPFDYPVYIREGRRPDCREREARDWTIKERWLREL